MCGIAGVYAFGAQAAAVAQPQLSAMAGLLAHRGPDGSGYWISPRGRLGLAHRRLAIIDPSALADQPLSDPTGRYQIILNGEIYNHAALRKELVAAGRTQWKTDHSDTEVIVQAFAHWGIDCLSRLRGMFAFALWDEVRAELWLVRDRLGIKPLYYALQGGRILFASEIKALLADRAIERRVDETALFHYLSFLVPPAPRTLFAGVQKLPAATWLRIGADGALAERKYWELLDHVDTPLSDPDAAARRVLESLEESVRLHKIADVPMGVFLSGGVDSSTNAVLFSRGESQPVRSFSIGYAGNNPSYPDELPYARRVAQHIGAEHHELRLTEADLERFLPEMIYLQDEPIADPVCVPVYYVSKLARDAGVKVCHVGEGADELFGGYPFWRTAAGLERAAALPLAGLAKRAGAALLAPFAHGMGFRYEWLRRSAAGKPLFWGGAEAFTEGDKRALLSPRLRADFARRSSWEVIETVWERFRRSRLDPHPLNWMAYLDLNLRLPELLLMRVDKMSMGVGLETRVPFLDHVFVQDAMGVDPRLRIRDGELKHVLKRAVRGLVPDEVLDRPKQGFGLPLREWMHGRLGGQVREAVDRFCAATDLLDAATVRRTLREGGAEQNWYLYNLALWWERHAA
jgi:asparagine synthase (glutamine-hydrolysing)